MTDNSNASGGARPRRGVCLTPMETRREVIVEMAILADRLGYEVFAVPEGWGFDSTLVLTEIALKTERIRPMSGILSVWSRTPGAIAMNAATLADISGGRYILGLGASTKALVEGFHAQSFARPAGRLRRTTAEVRRLLAGERAETPEESETRPLRLGQPPRPDLPIYIAAMGPRAVRVAAEEADGWFPFMMPRGRFGRYRAKIEAMRTASPAGSRPFEIAAGPTVAAGEREAARHTVASNLAWYLCAMGGVYANAISAEGFRPAVQAIQVANPKPSPKSGVVPEAAEPLLDQLTAYGPEDRVQAALAEWDAAVDLAMINLAPGMDWPDIEASLRAAAPRG